MCMIDGWDDTPGTLLHARQPAARKPHTCSECRRKISPGERYLVERIVFDGAASTYKTCAHCQRVREWLNKECGGFVYELVKEDIDEHVLEGYGVGVKMLAIGMARKWTRTDGSLWRLPSVPRASA